MSNIKYSCYLIIVLLSALSLNQLSLEVLKMNLKLNSLGTSKAVCFSPPTGNNPDPNKIMTLNPNNPLEFSEIGGDLWIAVYSADKTKQFQLLLHGWGNSRSEVQKANGAPICVNNHSENVTVSRAIKIEFLNGLVNYYRNGTKLWSCQTNNTTPLAYVNFAQWGTTNNICDVKNSVVTVPIVTTSTSTSIPPCTTATPMCFTPPTENNPHPNNIISFDSSKALEFNATGGEYMIAFYSADKTKLFNMILHGWNNQRTEFHEANGNVICTRSHSEDSNASRSVKIEVFNGVVSYFKNGAILWSCQINIKTPLAYVNFAQYSKNSNICNVKNTTTALAPPTAPKTQTRLRATFACDRFSVDNTYNTFIAHCAGGQQKRLQLAQCVHTEDNMLKDGGGNLTNCTCGINGSTLHCDCFSYGPRDPYTGGQAKSATRGSDWDLNKLGWISEDEMLVC